MSTQLAAVGMSQPQPCYRENNLTKKRVIRPRRDEDEEEDFFGEEEDEFDLPSADPVQGKSKKKRAARPDDEDIFGEDEDEFDLPEDSSIQKKPAKKKATKKKAAKKKTGRFSYEEAHSKPRRLSKKAKANLDQWKGSEKGRMRDKYWMGLADTAKAKFGNRAVMAGSESSQLIVGIPLPVVGHGMAHRFRAVLPLSVVLMLVGRWANVQKCSALRDLPLVLQVQRRCDPARV